MIREAAVDLRHNSLEELRLRQNFAPEKPFRRICILLTASPGVGRVLPLSSPRDKKLDGIFPKMYLKADGKELLDEGWSVEVDYILRDPLCRNRCPYANLKVKQCYPAEWQVIATLRGPEHIRTEEQLQEALEELMQETPAAARLELNLPVVLAYDNDKVAHSKLSVGLSCISGLEAKRSLKTILPLMPKRTECRDATGSVNVAGGALWGYKRTNPAGRREIANFAARSLFGSVRFDTVAVPVIGLHSVSEIMFNCRDDELCSSNYHEANENFLRELTLEVEDELKLLNVPRSLWARITLFPVCRLGTDFQGSERHNQGCKFSRYYGQGMTTDLSYILFSPFHKWFSSFDLDEYAVNESDFSRGIVKPLSAQIIFDRQNNLKGGGSSVLQIGWLEYDVKRFGAVNSTSAASGTRNSTRELLKTGGLEFRALKENATHTFNRTECWQQSRASNTAPGKSVVSCMHKGFGTSVHDSLALQNASDLNSRVCTTPSRFATAIALYHGSTVVHGPRFGNCAWRYRDN